MKTSTLSKLAYQIQELTFIENHDDGKTYCQNRTDSCNRLVSDISKLIEKPQLATKRDLSQLVIKCSRFREKLDGVEHRALIDQSIADLNAGIAKHFARGKAK